MPRLISNIHAPNAPWLRLQEIDKFLPDDHLHLSDVFSDQWFQRLIEKKGRPRSIFLDSYTSPIFDPSIDVDGIEFYCAEIWMQNQCAIFEHILSPSALNTQFAANLTVNRSTVNRYLALKLCEFFSLDVNYTWSGMGKHFDLSAIMPELDRLPTDAKSFLLAPIALEPRWVEEKDQINNGVRIVSSTVPRTNLYTTIRHVLEPTAITMITESIGYERRMQFSEKTISSVLALTMPLWVGGYQQAKWWSSYGFDVFDDIVDHSYQDHDSLVERCWRAVANNLDLLNDLPRCRELRSRVFDRLMHNRQHMHNLVAQRNQEIVRNWPSDIQKIYSPIFDMLLSCTTSRQ